MLSFLSFLTEETNPISVNVYHGSGRSFNKFEQKHARIANDHFGGGIGYFTDNHDVAKTYARSMARRPDATGPHVYHTTLQMNNVFDVDHEYSGDRLKNLLPDNPDDHENFARGAGLLALGGEDKYTVLNKLRSGKLSLSGAQVFKGLSRGNVDTAKTRQHLISKGYDGIRYNGGENMNMETRHNVYMPYNASAVTINKVTKF
jgi:hypothetical protein